MSWWADEVTDTNWLGPMVVLALTICLVLAGQVVTTTISADILENCRPDDLKESAKNIWTNIAVVSALMLTLVAAMLQADPMSPLDLNPYVEQLDILQQVYATTAFLSIMLNLISMLYCVLYLSYVEPLSHIDAIKFFIQRPDSLGDPITFLVAASWLMLAGMLIWMLGTYGLASALVGALGCAIMIFLMANEWRKTAKFSPSGVGIGYDWTQDDPATWPAESVTGSKFSRKKVSDRKQIQTLVKKLGKAIQQDGLENKIGAEPQSAVGDASQTNG